MLHYVTRARTLLAAVLMYIRVFWHQVYMVLGGGKLFTHARPERYGRVVVCFKYNVLQWRWTRTFSAVDSSMSGAMFRVEYGIKLYLKNTNLKYYIYNGVSCLPCCIHTISRVWAADLLLPLIIKESKLLLSDTRI